MVAKCLDLNKAWSFKYGEKTKTKKLNMYDFPVHNYIQEQNGSPYFVLFQQCNGRLYQERLLRSTNFATMVTIRRTSPLYTGILNWLSIYHLRCLVMTGCS